MKIVFCCHLMFPMNIGYKRNLSVNIEKQINSMNAQHFQISGTYYCFKYSEETI